MNIMAMTNDEKAKLYDRLLMEHDEKARQVSLIQSKFDLTTEDNAKIKTLKGEMDDLQRKAINLSR
jgi:hypothetical protein